MSDHQEAPRRAGRGPQRWIIALATVAVVAVGVIVYLLVGQHGGTPAAAPAPVASAAPSRPLTSEVPTFDMQGSFDIFIDPGATSLRDGDGCQGTGPNGETIGTGTSVRIFDHGGSQLAVSGLGNGKFARTPIGVACVFSLDVVDVPDGLPSYGVEVGTYGVKQVTSTQAHSNVFLSEGP